MWAAVFITAALTFVLGVLVTNTLAAITLGRLLGSELNAYIQSCLSQEEAGVLPRSRSDDQEAAALRRCLLLVRLVDALYIAKDKRAGAWAVRLDEYAPLLRDTPLDGYAAHPETKAALKEAQEGEHGEHGRRDDASGVATSIGSAAEPVKPEAEHPSVTVTPQRLLMIVSAAWLAGAAVAAAAFLWGYAQPFTSA